MVFFSFCQDLNFNASITFLKVTVKERTIKRSRKNEQLLPNFLKNLKPPFFRNKTENK